MIENAQIALKRLLIEIQMLEEILVGPQKKESCREIYRLREYICGNGQNVARNRHIRGAFTEISNGNEKKVI